MYCPECDMKLEIKENTKLNGAICPLCGEATLQDASMVVISPTYGMLDIYRCHNFHLSERLN
jgi:Zn-finger nucleic acid-binding protein